MKTLLPDKVYEVLKWLALIVIPAVGEAYARLANVWNLPYGQQVNETALIITFVLGALIGISTVQYNKQVSADIANIGMDLNNLFEEQSNLNNDDIKNLVNEGDIENVQDKDISTEEVAETLQ